MEKVAFFLPTRKGSQRVINKNTRPFAGMQGGLLENKLQQLIQSKHIDEIILSTNDEDSIRIATPFQKECARFRIIERPHELCLDSTNLQDLITYVPTITNAEHILWGHVTTPIADADVYDNAVKTYLDKLQFGYDSLVSVVELKNFLLDNEGKLINNTTSLPWPRTQDLEALYEINHVIFIAAHDIYEKQKNRIGKKPYLYRMDKIKSYDIDWEDDFAVAEMLFKTYIKE
jgi:N-acylneuraminate cytidylyltransferase